MTVKTTNNCCPTPEPPTPQGALSVGHQGVEAATRTPGTPAPLAEACGNQGAAGAPKHSSAQPCQGCGGAQYRPQDYNRPGGADGLIQQLA